jgi:S-adenosylmethionine:diacylglycerol 3-amino-3-carboxypropyl transferase
MDGANGQTGGKNSSSTFVLTALISFGLCNFFAHGKYFLQSAHLSHFPPPNNISLPSRSQVKNSQIGPRLN